VVRRDRGQSAPPTGMKHLDAGIPQWVIEKGKRCRARAKAEEAEAPVLEMVDIPECSHIRQDSARVYVSPFSIAKYEVSYAKWKQVYDWAVARGYEFDYDGDMGSMDYHPAEHRHGPQEPVTGIKRDDAYIWLTALSEMEGRMPCYYETPSCVKAKRTQHAGRYFVSRRSKVWETPPMNMLGDWDLLKYVRSNMLGGGFPNAIRAKIGVDWSADGYRLPTMAEWASACIGMKKPNEDDPALRPDMRPRYYWGQEPDPDGTYCWSLRNSGDTTHPVGLKPANPFGLHDMLGNVFEMCWGDRYMELNQSFHETWNPKGGERGQPGFQQGGSFRYPVRDMTRTFEPIQAGRSSTTIWSWCPFPDVGFRPVRCEKRTHRKNGSEMPEDILVLDLNLQEPADPLQGATHRANLYRNGVHYTQGVPRQPTVKWKFKTGDTLPESPLCYRGVVYVAGGDSFLYALDAETGAERWRFQLAQPPERKSKNAIPSAPTIKDGILYTGGGGYVYAMDIRTGRPKWKTTVRGARVVHGSPLPVYGAVFAKIGGHGRDTGLMALHGENGKLLTVYRNNFWGGFSTLSFARGHVYATGDNGITWVDMRSGSRGGSPNSLPLYCIPVICDDRIVTACTILVATDIRSGEHIFNVGVLENTRSRDPEAAYGQCEGQIAVWNEMIFLSTIDGKCRAFGLEKPTRLWTTELSARSRASVSVSASASDDTGRGIVYTGCDDGTVWALDAVDGKVLWKLKVSDAKIAGDLWISDGTVYAASEDGYIHALR
jgi:outer membrane protein assembly factor BamB/formylglycine-generating enzyme required for sulfatase activity